ncbi:TetR/AcrR family transcriptional regulator [Marinactinospora thermotolerans]|uniref:Transcriptional regulator, TetR family n=1 Tax=Marinactinospora thermotolerans DSM 45154 TaxID=1122192 RepID=A0A1T4LZA9_9ACTN|nr:TetR/AcrR family transcriptional regulator [Marinactinospora thermotolerans]SJZ59987.1 transcriptional regulator, TetR family [Marinactinospora thermotolerans DSM 45154]
MPQYTGRRRGPTKGELRERAILEGAARLLKRRPPARVTVEEIAAEAGISPSTFYFYFESKQAVLAALVGAVTARLRSDLGGWLAGDDAAGEALDAALATTACLWREQGALLRAAFFEPGTAPVLRAAMEEFTDWLVAGMSERIERDRRAGRALPGPPARALAAALVRAIIANFALAGETEEDADGRATAATLRTVIVRAIYGEEEPARASG